jgi:hypothetical protein
MPTETIGDRGTDTYAGSVDVKLRGLNPTTNYASAELGIFKYATGPDHEHTLVKFTGLSSISGPVTVSAATLYLYFYTGEGSGNNTTHEARRLLRDWVENQATWNIFSTGNSWATAGGLSDGNDRVAAVSGSNTFAGNAAAGYQAFTGAGLATDVEGWINGTFPNYGWHLERQGTGNDARYRYFRSSEYTTASQRPYLEITYTASSLGIDQMMAARQMGLVDPLPRRAVLTPAGIYLLDPNPIPNPVPNTGWLPNYPGVVKIVYAPTPSGQKV